MKLAASAVTRYRGARKRGASSMRAKKRQNRWAIRFLIAARAFTVGLSYYVVAGLPGLTSSFVAVFVSLLPFDLIVAMPRFSLRLKDWKQMVITVLPRISATAVTLVIGLLLGTGFGALTKWGLPVFLGAVFTVGLAYTAAEQTKANISAYVGIIGGLAVFDQVMRLEGMQLDDRLLMDISGAGLRAFYATFAALFAGWAVGVSVGIVTRLILPRGYRTTKSEAYARPLYLRSLKEVAQLDENAVVMKMQVGDDSDILYKPLSESGLRSEYDAAVMSIQRRPKDITSPRGSDIIYPGDVLVVLLPADQTAAVVEHVKGRVMDE